MSNSPKRERQSQDVTVLAEEDLGQFEKAWNNPDRLSKGKDSAPIHSHVYHSTGLSCFLRQLPPANLNFVVRYETGNPCDHGHYFRWHNRRLEGTDCPVKDPSIYKFGTALVSIAHLDDFDQLRSQIPPPRIESAADLFCDWVVLKLDRKDRSTHYVITVATDEYHIAKSDPGVRISRVEYDNTPQHDHQFNKNVFDAKESTVSGPVEAIPSLLATTIISLSACFAVRSYLPDSCSWPSIFDPRNWLASNEDPDGCMSP